MSSEAVDIKDLARAAEALLRGGKTAEAIDAYNALLVRSPQRPDDWYNLGYLQRIARQFHASLDSYAQALAHGVGRPEEVHLNRAAILSEQLFQYDAAEAELLAAVRVAPTFLHAWHNLGQLCEDQDNREGARAAYEQVLRLSNDDGRAHARLAAMDVFEGKAAEVAERLAGPLARATTGVDAAELGFAMANALDALGRFDEAFATAARANAVARRASPLRYDPAAQDRLIDTIVRSFAEPKAPSLPATQPRLIFICGMFRSGSTLCEQILARHSRVTAGGELEALPALAATWLAGPRTLSAATIAEMRDRYLSEVNGLFPDATVVTDKRPDNFMHIGLIKLLFPDATVIHTVRDPLDTMLSAWFLHFADSVAWSSDLGDMLHFWRGYRHIMRHWTSQHWDIATFDYDSFVADPMGGTHALLDACGLDWEDGCDPRLSASRAVRTASTWQVRQPVHSRSSGRWRNYASQLRDLRLQVESAQKEGAAR